MNKLFSVDRMVEGVKRVMGRFPAAVVMLLLLTSHLLVLIWGGKDPDALTFFLSVGTLLMLVLHLCTEDSDKWRWGHWHLGTLALWGGSTLLLAADSVALHQLDHVNTATYIAQSVGIAALVIVGCFVPFWHERDDQQSWNFVFRVAMATIVTGLISLVMLAGTEGLYAGTCQLFNLHSETKVISCLLVLTLVFLPGWLVMSRIPQGDDKHDERLPQSQFVLATVRYLFLPLIVLYLLVLYAYGLRILATLTLPKGTLSMLVSALMLGYVGVTFLYYPYRHDVDHQGYERRLLRWMPLLVLPLLVLMSVGLGRRLWDYGLSANRLYLLTLNLWFYGVAAGLWWRGHERIRWICISAVVLMIASSCHPWNYNKIYANRLNHQFQQLAEKYQWDDQEMSREQLRMRLRKMSREDREKMYDTMKDMCYLDIRQYRQTTHFEDYLYGDVSCFLGEGTNGNPDSWSMLYIWTGETLTLPQGYRHMAEIKDFSWEQATTDTHRQGKAWACNDSTITVLIGKRPIVIRHHDLNDSVQYQFAPADSGCILIPTVLNLSDNGKGKNHEELHVSLEGYVFTR